MLKPCCRCYELIDVTGAILWNDLCESCVDELYKEKKKKEEEVERICNLEDQLQDLQAQSMEETMHTMNELYINQ
jgi:hypothetical protein